MESYKEYPIRCKTCNEQIACFASLYENHINSGATIEDTLNMMDIMNPCSRQAFMNPSTVNFNMENRKIIEGFETVETATDEDALKESTSQPIFIPCLGGAVQTKAPLVLGVKAAPAPLLLRVQAATPARTQIGIGLPTIGLAKPTIGIAAPIVLAPKIVAGLVPDVISPIMSGLELGIDIQPIGEGIPIDFNFDVEEFAEPLFVGFPVINKNPLVPMEKVYVGANKYSQILNGRTYLAQ